MEFLAATFDHAHPGSQGNYWAYSHPDLETVVLDQLYFEVVAPSLRSHPEWAGLSVLSGFATLGPHWACWFKRFDVGNDLKGRPGRFVIACGFFERSKALGRDTSAALTSSHFNDVQLLARKHCPLPSPSGLFFAAECSPPRPVEQLISELGEKRSCQWNGPEVLKQLGSVVAATPLAQELRAFGWDVAGKTTVTVGLVTQPLPKPEALSAQNRPLKAEHGALAQAAPGNSPKTRDRAPSQRREFTFFVMGLLVGLGFGYWFGRQSGSVATRLPPGAERSAHPELDRANQKSTNGNLAPKRP